MTEYKRKVAFLDVETTGLSSKKHEIIEVGVVVTDAEGLLERETFESKVKPRHLEHASAKALEINGFTPEGWAEAPHLCEVLERLVPYLEGGVIAGHNVAFDTKFLEAAWEKAGHRPTGMSRNEYYDTMLRARALGLPQATLGAVCAHYGIEQPIQHRALADARASLACARAMAGYTDALFALDRTAPLVPRDTRAEPIDPHVDITLGMKAKDAHRGTRRPYFAGELRELKKKRNSLTVPG